MTSAQLPVRLDPPARLVRAVEAQEAVPGDTGGGGGRRWLAGVAELVRRYAGEWELTPERVLAPGGGHSMLVLVRTAQDVPAALRLSAPHAAPAGAAAARTAEALRIWRGLGAVQLLRSGPADGVLLLERLRGAVSLRSLAESKAVLEATATLQRLWLEPGSGHGFDTVAVRTRERAARLVRARAGVPEAGALIDQAIALREGLAASPAEDVLLHGDYHQGRVLAGERTPWLAVGPRPLVGERAYDLARLVYDRLDTLAAAPGAATSARRRVARLADTLEVDAERLRGWAYFRAVDEGMAALSRGERGRGELLLEFASWL
ncbi:aminoglycoside phosphotransferase family protein [Streptomyces polyrhachis]|uniref:Aminoglycoside phosphotransferase family protein n=1 Tax=Streptomyces polyrhachis TaxID=1282885 RepID=A0ABW2GEG8_9ACTN